MIDLNILSKIKALDIAILRKMQFENITKKTRIPTPTQMQILEYILKHENEIIYQKDLEDIFHLSRATVSSVLQTMEKYCLINRVVDDIDTRTKKIILDQKAREIFENHKKKIDELERKMIKNISKEELEIFNNVIEKMRLNISKEN